MLRGAVAAVAAALASGSNVEFSRKRVYAEEGSSTTYVVSLETVPSANVDVYFARSSTTLVDSTTASTTSPTYNIFDSGQFLRFTTLDYAAKTVTLTATENAVDSELYYQDVEVSHTVSSSDPNYASGTVGFDPSDVVTVRIYDDDSCLRDCAAGWYFDLCNATQSCLPCPPGRYCLGGCTSPVACAAGSYRANPGGAVAGDCTTCAPGTYALTAGSATCETCPSGYACAGGTGEPVGCAAGTAAPAGSDACDACPDGSYALAFAERCTLCPSGHACLNAATEPLPCTATSYALAGSTACSACPAGFACSSTASDPIPCGVGSYALENWAFCLSCPAGFACNATTAVPRRCPRGTAAMSGQTACAACANGTYADVVGSSRCTQCPAGFACSDTAASPSPCAAGNYSAPGATRCAECPLGSYSRNPASRFSSCEVCPARFYCPATDVAPVECPPGTVNVAGYHATCAACPAGTAVADDGTSCTACPRGYECPAPPTVVPCANGTYSLGGNVTACTPCPAGFACASSFAEPALCPVGYFSGPGELACEECPAGAFCARPDRDPVPCAAGFYALNGSAFCAVCPLGSACPTTNSTPVACPRGSYAYPEAAMACTECPQGSKCPDPTEPPVPCAAGQYALGNATDCLACQAGFFCNATDLPPAPCPYATYSEPEATQCEFCPLGFRLTNSTIIAQTGCDPCPRGSYCPYPERPHIVIPCAPGTYSLGAQHVCTACPPGEYCPKTWSGTRVPCPAGTFSTGAQAACTPCPAGFECATTDSARIATCAPGSFSPVGAAFCTSCPAGSYCPSAAQPPMACPAGTFAEAKATNCTTCDAGYFCATARAPPARCPRGYYSTSGATACAPCFPGFHCPEGSTSPSPAGSECPAGTFCHPASRIVQCPPGTYGNGTAGTSEVEACALCEAGYYCPKVSTTFEVRVLCPAGSYCPPGSYDPEPCPAGTYGDVIGALTSAACTACPPGLYCHEGVTSATYSRCAPGFYCPTGTARWDEFPCPAGTYEGSGGLHDGAQCQACLRGAYCPAGSTHPHPCPVGTLNPGAGAVRSTQCRPCEPGWACPTPGAAYVSVRCKTGHYCPAGTAFPEQYPCPAGSYSDADDLVDAGECVECPGGFYCLQGATTETIQPCGAGHYCPAGSLSATTYNCPAGRYSNRTNLAASAECSECPPGYYCTGGSSAVTGACAAGHFCPAGTSSSTANNCAAGTYSAKTDNAAQEDCTDCEPGYYCVGGLAAMATCSAGRFTPNNGSTADTGTSCGGLYPSDCVDGATTCIQCPAGWYCEAAATAALPCGVGAYSTAADSACLTCEAGSYCASNTTSQTDMLNHGGAWANTADAAGLCYPGTYCPAGMSRRPDLAHDACITGHYCPAGTAWPLPCPSGTYNALTGAAQEADCASTPPGFYTVEGATNISGLCAPGYYCDGGSTTAFDEPCPARYYNPLYGRTRAAECALCVSGGYCEAGSAKPTVCPRGSYCVAGVEAPAPCPVGTFGNSSGLRRSEDCTPCDPGYYCDGLGLPRPRGPCDPGYYCVSGSYTSAPHAPGAPTVEEPTSIGGRCPAGGYCPLASSWPTACPAGTFSNSSGAATEDDCFDCLAGYYCTGSNNPYPTGPCRAGYYCESGSTTPTQYECAAGRYSDGAAAACEDCQPGTWQPYRAQASCEGCPAGYYCPDYGGTTFRPCPVGFYCPEGTAIFAQYPCPFGMYGAQTLLVAVDECSFCDAGEYCAGSALSAPTGSCSAGYYCGGGAFDAEGEYCIDLAIYKADYDPASDFNVSVADAAAESYLIDCGDDGGGCIPGYSCAEKSSYPFPCPLGTYYASTLNTGDCTTCDPGYACDDSGLAAPLKMCDPGFFCRNVANGATSTQPLCFDTSDGCEDDYGPCPKGHECGEGTIEPSPCEMGTYAPIEGLEACYTCPAGSYCNASKVLYDDCPRGAYCPPGTGSLLPQCPPGRYGHASNLKSIEECALCPEGFYCAVAGMTAAGPGCGAGSYCPLGSWDASGTTALEGAHPCPQGTYCPAGSKTPALCAAGKYSAATSATAEATCGDCDDGSYCERAGLAAPTAQCDAGFYCGRGVDTPRPLETICPAGSYCEQGVTTPTLCDAGTFAPVEGLAVCETCPPGYGCAGGTVDYEDLPCRPGYYCPAGSATPTEVPCPAGFWSNLTLASSDWEACVAMPPGSYATGVGNARPTGLCDAGYYCTGRATTPNPVGETYGDQCAASSDCPAGSTFDRPCPGGQFCNGLGVVGACAPGYYCTSASTSRTPANLPAADGCPTGHYCPLASTTPTACPPGTFNNRTHRTNVTDCVACTEGFVCPNASTVLPTVPCARGYSCPQGAVVGAECPAGTYCPPGSPAPTPCQAGRYQPSALAETCDVCPSGYFCLANAATYADCPAGHYCPNGTTFPTEFPCPNGTFSNWTRLQALDECTTCLPDLRDSLGMYCADAGLTAPTGACSPGFFCAEGSDVARPDNTWDLIVAAA